MPEGEKATDDDWVLLIDWRNVATRQEAQDQVVEVLRERGIDAEAIRHEDIRLDIGSYRGGVERAAPYFRAWVRATVIADRPER